MKPAKELVHPNAEGGPTTRDFAKQTLRALEVCDLLQELADELPSQSLPKWRDAQTQCSSFLQPYFLRIDQVVLPNLLNQNKDVADQMGLLNRLKSDCFAQVHALSDLDELITDALASGRFANEPEALGYALRGHFELLRRDLLWQLDVLWPLAARTWSSETARELQRVCGFVRYE